jgi:hypothetical protein
VLEDRRRARKWLTQKNTGGESLRLLVGGRKREEGREGSEKDQGSWLWWNGSSGWSGQRLAGGQRTMSLANWSPRRHFYRGRSTGAGGIWWVGHPRGTGHTRENFAVALGMGKGERGRAGSPFPGSRGENTLIGQCRKGGSAPGARHQPVVFISRAQACLAAFFLSQLEPSQWMWCLMPFLFPPPFGTPTQWITATRGPSRSGLPELRQFAVCRENFHMALICEAMRLHPRAGGT